MTASHTLGLVRIGAIDLAVPAALIEEVVRGPLELSVFPQAPLHVLGAFALRGAPVPVVDLAVLIKPQRQSEPARPVDFAIVINHAGGRFAIQVDAVLGVVNALAETITAVGACSEHGYGLFSQLYTPSSGGRVAALLDLDALLAVEGVRSAATRVAVMHDVDTGALGRVGPYVLFRVVGVCLALESVVVRQVERRAGVLDSTLDHPLLLGFHRLRGELMAVINLAGLLGLPASRAAAGAGHFLVIESADGGGAIALCVDEIVTVEALREADVQPISAEGGVVHAECFAGNVVRPQHGVVMVLKSAELLRAVSIFERADVLDENRQGRSRDKVLEAPVHHLVYRAGGFFLATPLIEIEAVASVPSDYVDMREGGRPLVGMCSRNGRPVKLIDLAMLFGSSPLAIVGGMMMVVTNTGQGLQGYVVESVDFMQTAVPRPLPHPDRRSHGEVPPFRQMIRTRGEGREKAACVLNLVNLAAQIPAEHESSAA